MLVRDESDPCQVEGGMVVVKVASSLIFVKTNIGKHLSLSLSPYSHDMVADLGWSGLLFPN